MLCPQGHPTSPGSTFCTTCGLPLVPGQAPAATPPPCGTCGAPAADTVFCTGCGALRPAAAPPGAGPAPVAPAPVAPAPVAPVPFAPPAPAGRAPRRTPVVVAVLAAAVLAAGAVAGGVLLLGEEPAADRASSAEDGTDPDGDPDGGAGIAEDVASESPTGVADDEPSIGSTPSPAVDTLPVGLLCRDTYRRGLTYGDAVAYWQLEGRPARMDADVDGIPCETVYPEADVRAEWGALVDTATTDVAALPRGQGCAQLRAWGVAYPSVVEYWFAEGAPDAMDSDGDGLPCTDAYPLDDLAAYAG